MILVEQRGGFMYQHCRDLFPYDYLTNEEVALWAAYHDRKAAATGKKA